MKITKKMMRQARTAKGAYSLKQIRFAKEFTKVTARPMLAMVGMDIDPVEWEWFCSNGRHKERWLKKRANKKETLINPMSRPDGWSWKPERQDFPEIKTKRKNRKAANQKKRKEKGCKDDFYISKEWRQLRVRVLEKYGCACMMCGRSRKEHKVILHVDHIKPRSKFPELALEFNNLQVLCEDCNIGKSNKYQTDWRPEIAESEEDELELVYEASKYI